MHAAVPVVEIAYHTDPHGIGRPYCKVNAGYALDGHGHGSLGGGLVAGGIAAMAVLGIYYLIQNREDKESRKIYSFFALLGIAMCLTTLHLFGVDSFLTAWGMYVLLGFILGKLNQ